MRASVAVFAAVGLCATAATAHPHVFIDARAQFLIDAEGRLAGVRLSHLYDALVSLFVLQDLGLDPFAELTPVATARLAEEHRALIAPSGGFAEVALAGGEAEATRLETFEATLENERLRVDFTLALEEPAELDGGGALLAVFDPVYFISFRLTDVDVEHAGCVTEALEWTPSGSLLSLQADLFGLPADATPEDRTVGRLFAAEARLTCSR